VGGFVGYFLGLFIDNGLPSIVRFVQHSFRRRALNQVREKQAKRKR
jgi:hypothetical protein